MIRYPETPDGRYFVAKGRLWRRSDPALLPAAREAGVKALMAARRAVRIAATEGERAAARAQVDAAKRALGERGPVWWDDGAPDETRHSPKTTRYAAWFDALSETERAAAGV